MQINRGSRSKLGHGGPIPQPSRVPRWLSSKNHQVDLTRFVDRESCLSRHDAFCAVSGAPGVRGRLESVQDWLTRFHNKDSTEESKQLTASGDVYKLPVGVSGSKNTSRWRDDAIHNVQFENVRHLLLSNDSNHDNSGVRKRRSMFQPR